MWTCIFPDIPVTKKPAEVRMGKGKGSIHYWMARIAKGHILYEMDGVSEKIAFEAFQHVQNKLPFSVTFVKYNEL